MKKSLLFACVAGLVLSAGAQNRTTKYVVKVPTISSQAAASADPKTSNNATIITPAQRKTPLVVTNTAVNDIALGWSANAFGGYTRPARSICYADPNLNAVVVTHRSGPTCTPGDGTSGSGSVMFDYSKTGGTTWNPAPSLGPVFDAGAELARYPNGAIYNPASNTNPDNAYIAVYGPCTGPTMASGGLWIADFNGAAQLGNPATTANQSTYWYDSTVSYIGLIPDCMVIDQTGTAWVTDIRVDGTANYTYTDSVVIHKGVWNTTNNMYDFTNKSVYFPCVAQTISGTAIAFAPNGQTGYFVASCNNDLTINPDTSMFLSVMKTTDGGATWGAPIKISNAPAATALGGSGTFSTAWNPDASVDANGNLYITTSIFPSAGGGSINTAPGSWGQFAVYTLDGGTTWKFKLLDKPSTYITGPTTGGSPISEYTRGQIATNWACNKMVFVWFDTDTNQFAGGTNSNPDALAMFYDVTTDTWGSNSPLNLTTGTASDGALTFGDVSYYLLPGGSSTAFKVPMSYQVISGGDESVCTQWHYVDGVELSTSVKETNDVFNVVDAYPNPSSGVTTINVTMKKADNVSVEITNMLGQVVYTTNANLSTGTHKFTLDASSWNTGVYFYTVKTKDFAVTNKLVRE